MSLEKILKKIIDDAQAEADKIILESQKKAEEIKEKGRKKASDLAEALVKEAERQGHLEASRIITQARLEKKINTLSRKKELIEEVLEKAFQRGAKGKERLKRKIIMKEGESEEPYDEEKLKEELRSKLENEILEALKI
jgi:V/A-type H+-transporting ATPase subunit E